MKIIIIFCIVFFTTTTLNAQEWLIDFEQAKEIAKKENKTLIMSFRGSDWCAPCIMLEKEYFSNEEFITYAKSHFVLLKVDFPRRKKNKLSKAQTKHNNNLAEKYNNRGNFPLIVVFNPSGKLIKKIGYNESISISDFIAKLDVI